MVATICPSISIQLERRVDGDGPQSQYKGDLKPDLRKSESANPLLAPRGTDRMDSIENVSRAVA